MNEMKIGIYRKPKNSSDSNKTTVFETGKVRDSESTRRGSRNVLTKEEW